jgi:hypothetical protein
MTSDVTSNDTVVFAAIGAGEAIAVAPVAGPIREGQARLGPRRVRHRPDVDRHRRRHRHEHLQRRLRRAPVIPCTSNFRYDTVTGEPSTFIAVAIPKFDPGRSA